MSGGGCVAGGGGGVSVTPSELLNLQQFVNMVQ